jgi:hypothetical protein
MGLSVTMAGRASTLVSTDTQVRFGRGRSDVISGSLRRPGENLIEEERRDLSVGEYPEEHQR